MKAGHKMADTKELIEREKSRRTAVTYIYDDLGINLSQKVHGEAESGKLPVGLAHDVARGRGDGKNRETRKTDGMKEKEKEKRMKERKNERKKERKRD